MSIRPSVPWQNWNLDKLLGEGGNGQVWSATTDEGEIVAVKFLRSRKGAQWRKRYARFRSEVEILTGLSNNPGVIPVIKSNLPDRPSQCSPICFVMPLAEPAFPLLAGKLDESVAAAIDIADTLVGIHATSISHRDIKPDNILKYHDKYCLSDWGLGKSESSKDLTGASEAVGPKWTIAPEMRRGARTADGRPADVYSLAKTLWIFITGNRLSYDGQYAQGSVAASEFQATAPGRSLRPIEALFRSSTSDAPGQRPTMETFRDTLREWLDSQNDFGKLVSVEWNLLIRSLVPEPIPEQAYARWSRPDEMITVLGRLGSVEAINHAFFPDGGGFDMVAPVVNRGDGTVEMQLGSTYQIGLKSLTLVAYIDLPLWSYVWIETVRLNPLGRVGLNSVTQTIVEMANGELFACDHYERTYDMNGTMMPLPNNSRSLIRLIEGPLVVFAKKSPYNLDSATYDGRHEIMGQDVFRDYIQAHVDSLRAYGTLPRKIGLFPSVGSVTWIDREDNS